MEPVFTFSLVNKFYIFALYLRFLRFFRYMKRVFSYPASNQISQFGSIDRLPLLFSKDVSRQNLPRLAVKYNKLPDRYFVVFQHCRGSLTRGYNSFNLARISERILSESFLSSRRT